MLDHGGNLDHAVLHYGSARADWLDLSTGINPHSYPVPTLTADIWHRLPESGEALPAAARACYGAPHVLATAGSQAAIQALHLLRLFNSGVARVVIGAPAYAEHAFRWRQTGHAVHEVAFDKLDDAVRHCDVMLICNPNNPTGARIVPEVLLGWAQQVAARGGWLIVDEAFADMTPSLSVAARSGHQAGLIVLRSIGKFFGLAGLRLGFVAAQAALLETLREWLGPWQVNAAAQCIGTAALLDTQWQDRMRTRLQVEGDRLHALLAEIGIDAAGSALYQWWPEKDAVAFHDRMARQGIWVRLFAGSSTHGIRLGLPADEAGWRRLQLALYNWRDARA